METSSNGQEKAKSFDQINDFYSLNGADGHKKQLFNQLKFSVSNELNEDMIHAEKRLDAFFFYEQVSGLIDAVSDILSDINALNLPPDGPD
jgi:DNA topoisomerase IB